MSVLTLDPQEIIGDLLLDLRERHPAALLQEHEYQKQVNSPGKKEFGVRAEGIIGKETSATEVNAMLG